MRNQRPKVSKEYFFRHPGSFPITMKWIATSYLVYGSPEAQSCQQGIWLEADSWWLGLWAWVSCPPGSWELLLPWLSCAPTPLGWNKSVYCHGKEWSSSVTVLVQSPSQVVPDSWQPHPAAFRLFCPPLSPIVFSNSHPLSQWCRINLISCRLFLLLPSVFPGIMVFSNESAFHTRWPKYWSFSFSHQSF